MLRSKSYCQQNVYYAVELSVSGDYKELISTMSRIENCNEELKDGVSSVEFFNQHIKHLLLDEQKFKNQSSKIDNLHADMTEVKTQINLLMEHMTKTPEVNSVPVLSPETETALKKLSSFPTEKISHIENQMSNLSTQVSTLEININNKDPLQTTVFHQQMEDLISKSTNPSDLSPKLKESIEKFANFPLEKIDKIGDDLETLSGKFETLQNHKPVNTPSTRETTGMEPNTCSPRLNWSPSASPVNKIKPFTQYKDNAITPELKASLVNLVQIKENDFKTVGTDGSRDVLYFGEYSYRYTGGEHESKEMPKELDDLISHIRSQLPNPDMRINSCLISRYKTGVNHIPAHRDNEPVINPESDIVTISVGSERNMSFTDNSGSSKIDQKLSDGSMLVTSRHAQDFWLHEIKKDESAEVRYSFTLQDVSPHFINSTIILGDSNTRLIKFGTGKGTLGTWMPGKHIKVGHIEAIPEAVDIGPYRNVVIHTGVNSINNPRYRKSNLALIKILESKIKNINNIYPRTKIFISLLLPSRSVPLNHRIRDFNSMILDMTCRFNTVSVVEHSIFGSLLSNEHGRWMPCGDAEGDYVPKLNDLLHLGKNGLRLFAMSIKNAVVRKQTPQSRERFDAGRGEFRSAAVRGFNRQRNHQSP